MAQMLPYIFPLILGRTFNLDTMEMGIDIFPKDAIDNPVVLHSPLTENHYKVLDSSVESRDLLDVEGAFSLKVKSGIFTAGVSGAYLTDKYDKENTVQVAVKSIYHTVTEQLAPDAKPLDMWSSMGGSAMGTHFVRSIVYGGELITSVRMECNNTRDKQRIKAALDVGGRVEVFDLGIEAEGEYLKDIAKSVESTKIKIFSSIPLSRPPNDMKSLKNTLDTFPEDLNNFNGGKGVPIKVELWPLAMLDASRPEKLRNRVLEAHLDTFEQKFDDLLNTKAAIADWMKIIQQPLTAFQEKKIGELYAEVEEVLRPFYEVIGSLDMTKDTSQLKAAEDAYGASIPGAYYKKYRSLRQEVSADQAEWSTLRGSGATYVHWGRANCSYPAHSLSSGSVFGPSGYGGGADFICLAHNESVGHTPGKQKSTADMEETSFQFPNGVYLTMSCSNCQLGSRGTVETLVGTSQCPVDWDKLYDGVLMSGTGDSVSTNFVCLDRNPDEIGDGTSIGHVVPDWANVVGKSDDQQMLIVCAVCAK